MSKLTKGFTLTEILVVISIIGILAAIASSSLSDARARARFTQVETTMDQTAKAAQMYRFQKGYWPADVSPKINGEVPEFSTQYSSYGAQISTGAGENLPKAPCEGYVYDWQNWPDYTDWTPINDYNRPKGEKIVKLSLYDDSTPDRQLVYSKCIYTETNWKCPLDEPGGQGADCCSSPTDCASKPSAVDCVDISTVADKRLFCN